MPEAFVRIWAELSVGSATSASEPSAAPMASNISSTVSYLGGVVGASLGDHLVDRARIPGRRVAIEGRSPSIGGFVPDNSSKHSKPRL